MRFKLLESEEGLSLVDTERAIKPLVVSFASSEFSRRLKQAGKKSELIARAVKAGPGVRVLDCTAGLGRDAFVLAHLGCEVALLEKSVVLCHLLRDALERAGQTPGLRETASRLQLQRADAAVYLKELVSRAECPFDAIYMDPMFPERTKAAEVKGEMQYLQHFIGKDENAATLLSLALDLPCPRIVLKRPVRSDWQAPVSPTHTFKAKASQFEVYSGDVG